MLTGVLVCAVTLVGMAANDTREPVHELPLVIDILSPGIREIETSGSLLVGLPEGAASGEGGMEMLGLERPQRRAENHNDALGFHGAGTPSTSRAEGDAFRRWSTC
jgi:hypothetical protein